MRIVKRLFIGLALAVTGAIGYDPEPVLLKDINIISRFWGQISPYADNSDNYFGVDYVGLPDTCQVVSILCATIKFEEFLIAKQGSCTLAPTSCQSLPDWWRR